MSTPSFPGTGFVSGQVDDPFGGQPANRFGAPMREFMDAQIRELQTQAQDQWWSLRALQYLPIVSSGVAGDAIVFDASAAAVDGGPTFRTIASTTYTTDVTIIVGILLEPVSANNSARVCTGGIISASVSGLSGSSKGEITIDTTTGRLRAKATGEQTRGYCDGNGNCYLLPTGMLP
jgi:hypothetical protein